MTPADQEALRRALVGASHTVHARGWVANHDGNLSARLDEPGDPPVPGTDDPLRMLCTPTAVSKGDVQPEWLIEADGQRNVLHGTRRAFSELALHVAAYRARPDIRVVVHAHPPTTTGFLVAGVALPHPMMAEPVVSLGPELPLVPYAAPGGDSIDAELARALQRADVVLLDRHGVLAVGGSFEQALLRIELVEHQAAIALVAHRLGGARPLPPQDIAALAKRGRPASNPPRTAPAAPQPAPTPQGSATLTGARPDVGALVADALSRYR